MYIHTPASPPPQALQNEAAFELQAQHMEACIFNFISVPLVMGAAFIKAETYKKHLSEMI